MPGVLPRAENVAVNAPVLLYALILPGFHYYTLIIDGAEVSDPNTHAFFGGGKPASGVQVPEPGSTYYSAQDVPPRPGPGSLVQLKGNG
jgi:hypothetical protein